MKPLDIHHAVSIRNRSTGVNCGVVRILVVRGFKEVKALRDALTDALLVAEDLRSDVIVLESFLPEAFDMKLRIERTREYGGEVLEPYGGEPGAPPRKRAILR
jgi:hypothetical protein